MILSMAAALARDTVDTLGTLLFMAVILLE